MTVNKKASGVVAHTGTVNPFNYEHQKAQSFYPNYYEQFNQEQEKKRDDIFRTLIAGLRGERFEPNGEFMELIFEMPRLNYSKNFGSLDQDQLWELGVCAVPNFILNALICEQLQNKFGDLSICDCFYQIDGYWRLDIDPNLARRGLLMPVRSEFTGLIHALKVFRYPDDPKPFTLKLRGGKRE